MTLAADRRSTLATLAVSRETEALLDAFVERLLAWQPIRNLIAPSTLETVWSRHVLDCAQLAPLVPADARRIVDLGSGAGFPGLVLAILLRDRPDIGVTLIDSDHRKAAFLRLVARELALPCDIRAERIDVAVARIPHCDVVTARALAPMPGLLALAAPLLISGALGLFMKGERLASELTDSGPLDTYDITITPSRTQAGASIVHVRAKAS